MAAGRLSLPPPPIVVVLSHHGGDESKKVSCRGLSSIDQWFNGGRGWMSKLADCWQDELLDLLHNTPCMSVAGHKR